MDILSGKLTARDGLSLFWKTWVPEKKPKALIHIIHGYAEHIDRYTNVVEQLIPHEYALFGSDHRGHGRSDGKRGHVNRFQDFIDDEYHFSQEVIRRKFPDIPYFMLGHSMGSLIALNYVEQHRGGIRGLVLSGTGSAPGAGVPKILLVVTSILSRLLPGIHVKSPLPPDFISRDPAVVKAYEEDPLVYNVITPRLAHEMNTAVTIGAHRAGTVSIPVLIQLGSQDTAFSGQRELFDALGSKDKTFKIYEGLKHEVYNELPEDRATVLDDLLSWLDSHL